MVDFTDIPDGITHQDVLQALSDIDGGMDVGFGESTKFDLVHEGKRYSPKEVIGLAARRVIGRALKPSEFSGGEASKCFRVLRTLGFAIHEKVQGDQVNQIQALLDAFFKQAATEELSVRGYLDEYEALKVKVSFGKGNPARIPWIAFLGSKQEVNEGIYPVLLYFKEEKQLLLCFGVSETNTPSLSWGNLQGYPTVKEWFLSHYKRGPDRYGESFVMKAYDVAQSIDINELTQLLSEMIRLYQQRLAKQQALRSVASPAVPDVAQSVKSFSTALEAAGVSFGVNHDRLVLSFISSLLAKPLAILTGMSGSGKTQIAMRFGEWLGADQFKVIAVRPDWTGSEYLFGYEDGLRPRLDGRATWSVPPALEFMLRAAGDPQRPYLLLLDEMNLAHVERYFADVLSGMESGQPCLPNLQFEKDAWRVAEGTPPFIPLPKNLWIVGTVNIDETTYMFSPKVLDRANTFEFRVLSQDLTLTARKPSKCEPGDNALIRGLVSMASDDSWQLNNAPVFLNELAVQLRALHEVLSRHGFEFGHRVFYEALRFAAFANKAGLATQEDILDRIVFQKVLPRLHGARRRLELPLLALAHFCRDLSDVAMDDRLQALKPELCDPNNGPRLRDSYDKVCRMLRSLRANQFASFTE